MPLSSLLSHSPPWTCFAASDEITVLAAANGLTVWYMPACIIMAARASFSTAANPGASTIDIKNAGVSIFTTVLSIDATENSSQTAAVPAVLDPTKVLIADDSRFSCDLLTVGTGAKGLKVEMRVQWL